MANDKVTQGAMVNEDAILHKDAVAEKDAVAKEDAVADEVYEALQQPDVFSLLHRTASQQAHILLKSAEVNLVGPCQLCFHLCERTLCTPQQHACIADTTSFLLPQPGTVQLTKDMVGDCPWCMLLHLHFCTHTSYFNSVPHPQPGIIQLFSEDKVSCRLQDAHSSIHPAQTPHPAVSRLFFFTSLVLISLPLLPNGACSLGLSSSPKTW